MASAGALAALIAFKQDVAVKSVPAARPQLRPAALNGTRATQGTATVADVVTTANAFIATLNTTQLSTLQQAFNTTNVAKWSNLPVNSTNRIGLRFDALTTAQQTAALAVVQAATGTAANEGYNEVQQIRAAHDYLAANGGARPTAVGCT
ncbi:MAG: DUF3500 domain-containing protein [Hymenobacter sp.]|nr:MAG: DUF3500 domain-containing protein [Hymenobacter sp.]